MPFLWRSLHVNQMPKGLSKKNLWNLLDWDSYRLYALSVTQPTTSKSKSLKNNFKIGTCEASRFDSNSNRTSRFKFDSIRFAFYIRDHVPIRKFRIGTTQLPHDNRHWTCKRLPPDSVRDSIRIRIVATYSIRNSIRTEISDSQVPSLKV